MSENLMENVAPQLAVPVSREPLHLAAEAGSGIEQASITVLGFTIAFADDDAE